MGWGEQRGTSSPNDQLYSAKSTLISARCRYTAFDLHTVRYCVFYPKRKVNRGVHAGVLQDATVCTLKSFIRWFFDVGMGGFARFDAAKSVDVRT